MTEELEWQTRRDRINKKLKSLNTAWTIIKYKDSLDTASLACHAVEEYPTANGPADYALFVHGKLLGIIEAKKVKVGPQNVLEQAKRYARGVFGGYGNWNGYHVPFLYSTNGELIFHIDVRNEQNLSLQIANFHTADALIELFKADKSGSAEWLQTNPDNIEKLRPYQKDAISSIETAMIQGKRNMLIAMATGTGKTFTAVAQIYRLLESKAAKRVLFLVDRRALAAQAVRELSSFNTPKGGKFDNEPAAHSLSLFKEVVYRYTTDKAVGDGFLVDYEPVKIKSNVRLKGAFLKKGDPVGIVDTDTGAEIFDAAVGGR